MKRLFPLLTLAAIAPLLGGCPPPLYGLSRSAALTHPPDLACLRKEAGVSPAAAKFSPFESGGGQDVFGNEMPKSYSFTYLVDERSQILASLTVTITHDGSASYDNQMRTRDEKTAEAASVANRPAMIAFENDVSQHCGVAITPGTFKEECEGFKCSVFGAADR